MERLLTGALALACIACSAGAAAGTVVHAGVDVGVVDGGPLPSFQRGSQGKLRYGRDDDGLQLMSGYVQVESDVSTTWQARLALDYNSQSRDPVGVTDAYLEFRPLPASGIRWRVKLGAFRPPVSFEHGSEGWQGLYTTNASALNSWVGEELGGAGLAVSARRDLAVSNARWYWSGGGALFYGNDPAGTLLSWRGWSANNWQTHWGERIPLAHLPLFDVVPRQAHAAEPFLELDDKPGYYAWAETGEAAVFRLRALHYDNRADAQETGHGQSGWHTRFNALGGQLALPARIGLVAQWLRGSTYAGPELFGRHAIDNDFDASFVLLTRRMGRHRLTARREWFGVDDRDFNPIDPNDEDGSGWTLSYQYAASRAWRFSLEWLEIESTRPARAFESAPVHLTERAWFLTARWRR